MLTSTTNLEEAAERTNAKELDSFGADETLLTHLESELAKQDPASPQYAQMAALLDQHRAATTDIAATELAAEKAAAAQAASQARTLADQLRAEASATRRHYDDEIDQLTSDTGHRTPTTASPSAEPDAATERGSTAPITDSQAAHQAQILADMRANPIRMRDDAQLDQLIGTLRRAATGRDTATVMTGGPRQPRVEEVQAAHAQLADQADTIRTAQHAQAEADTAGTAADTARRAVARATADRDALPTIRVSARRAAQQRLDELTTEHQRATTARDQARATARAAADAARAAGAPQPQWVALLARAEDRTALAAELQQAQLDDERDEEIRRRTAERAARAADDLQAALAERDRRSGLSPIDAATEHQLRTTRSPRNRPNGPSLEQQHAAQQQAEQEQRSRDQGPEL